MAKLLAAIILLVAASQALAHHSWPVDSSREVTVRGTVTGIDWRDPHPSFDLDVKTDAGTVEKWKVGGPALNRMEANGWTKSTLKAGDVITAVGHRFNDGSPVLRTQKITMADGKEMRLYARR